MLVTLLGIVTEVKPEQAEKAELPILVTLLGIVIVVKLLHPRNALSPMLVTLPLNVMMPMPLEKVWSEMDTLNALD